MFETATSLSSGLSNYTLEFYIKLSSFLTNAPEIRLDPILGIYEYQLNFLNLVLTVEIAVTIRATVAERFSPVFLCWDSTTLHSAVTVIGTYCTRIAHFFRGV